MKRTFYVNLDTSLHSTSETFTVEADDYRYNEQANKVMFFMYEGENVAEYDFGKYTRVHWINDSGFTEPGLDWLHKNPKTRRFFHVGSLRNSQSMTTAERSQAQEEQALNKCSTRVEADTYAYNELEDKLIFYNEWSERTTILEFGPDTWVRYEDEGRKLAPEATNPLKRNPKTTLHP